MSLLLVVGWTERIVDQLLADGTPTDLTGMTVQLVAYNNAGPVTLRGTPGIQDALTGKVYFDADPADFATKGNIKIRWKVTDGAGKVAFFPNSIQPDVWIISKA